jgi:hypothetical protein
VCADGIHHLGDTEIQNLDVEAAEPVWLQPNILRLQISMDHPHGVSCVQRRSYLFDNVQDQAHRQGAMLLAVPAEARAIQILYSQLGNLAPVYGSDSKVRYVDDVWMAEPAQRFSLAPETRLKLGIGGPPRRDDLQGHGPLGAKVGHQKHRTHAAATEWFLDAVLAIKGQAGECERPNLGFVHGVRRAGLPGLKVELQHATRAKTVNRRSWRQMGSAFRAPSF